MFRTAAYAAVLTAAVIVLTGCTPDSTPPAATNTPTGASTVLLEYAPSDPRTGEGHLLHLYLPARKAQKRVPLIVWTGGNGWLRDDGGDVGESAAQLFGPEGYAVAGVNIRSSAQATFPAQLTDIQAAIHYLRINAHRYGLDPNRFGVAGDSSGGWAALMAALAETEGGAAGSPRENPVRAVAAFYPPTDFATLDRDLPSNCVGPPKSNISSCQADASSPASRLLGCALPTCPAALVQSASPVTLVDRQDPPMLLLHGQQDDTVGWRQSQRMFDAARAAGARAQLILLPHGNHGPPGDFLFSAATTTGALSTVTRGGTVTAPAPITLGPDVLVDFFTEAMR
ncbi:alpha/beta hydrolase fold domain-containing protein [Leifsonia sp. NPDC056824]|uniref:alpha/beta hydrolase fold domain-containing protein n=1 Tax=Leifsonia sp. NPDC056824 TaxID=3345953 RepID=UPI003687ACC9